MIDTHCHLDLYNNPHQILEEVDSEGITVIGMTNLPSHFEMGYEHVKGYKKVRLALGMHPLNSDSHELEFTNFLRLKHLTSYIGEIGLDFSKEGMDTKEIQVRTFQKILSAIEGEKKLLSIHSRRAEKEVFQYLIKYNIKAAVFHWYSGPLRLIDSISKSGYYFSINTSMLKSKAGIERILKIPQNRVLTETDGPFIEEGGRPVKPKDVSRVILGLSKIWGCDFAQADRIINSNFKSLLENIK